MSEEITRALLAHYADEDLDEHRASVAAAEEFQRRYCQPPHVTLSREEVLARINAGARKRLGMSGVAMLRAYRAGELDHDEGGGIIDLLALSDLLRRDDPVWDRNSTPKP